MNESSSPEIRPRRITIKKLCLFVLSVLPALLWVTWYHSGPGRERYSSGDSVSYSQLALGIHSRIINANPADALETVFTLRNRRQTAAHLPLLGGLLLTHGDTQKAQAVTNIALFSIFLVYLYVWLTRAFPPGALRLSIFWFLSTQPWLLISTTTYQSELPYAVACMAGLFHLVHSDYLRDKRHTIAGMVAFGLCACIRPVETTLVLALPAIAFIHRAYKRENVRARDLMCAVAQLSVVTVTTLVVYTTSTQGSRAGLATALTVLLLFIGYLLRAKDGNRAFAVGFGLALLLPTVWLIPYVSDMRGWLEQSVFWAVGQHKFSHLSDPLTAPLAFARDLYVAFIGPLLLALLVVIALLGVQRRIRGVASNRRNKPFDLLMLYLLVIPHPLIAFLFRNGDVRYYTVEAFILVAAIIIACSSIAPRFVLTLVLTIGTCAQLSALSKGVLANPTVVKAQPRMLVEKLLPRGHFVSVRSTTEIRILTDALYTAVKRYGVSKAVCLSLRPEAWNGRYGPINMAIAERHPEVRGLCRSLSTWSDPPPSLGTPCKKLLYVFFLGDLSRAAPSDFVKMVREQRDRDHFASWGLSESQTVSICPKAGKDNCESYAITVRECANSGNDKR